MAVLEGKPDVTGYIALTTFTALAFGVIWPLTQMQNRHASQHGGLLASFETSVTKDYNQNNK